MLRMNDDLFQQHTMSFGEHLEQLRLALMKAIVWLVVGTVIGFYFSEQVVQWMAAPFREQLRQYHIHRVTNSYQRVTGVEPPGDFVEMLQRQNMMPRAGYVLVASEFDAPLSFREADASKRHAWQKSLADGRITSLRRQVWLEPIPDSLNSFGIFEGFFVYLQASLIVGVTLALPGMFWHLWNFVAAGLYKHERRKVYTLLPLAVILFVAGASLAYFVMIDLLIEIMLQYNLGLGIEMQPRVKDCFSLAMWMPLIFGLCFQLPLVMMVLSMLKVVPANGYVQHQKMALLGITIVSMILTPADPYTFIGLMIPLGLLYYVGIVLSRWIEAR